MKNHFLKPRKFYATRPVYRIRREDEEVEMVQGPDDKWWFRHREPQRVWLKHERCWKYWNLFGPWECPINQPDPRYMPGSGAVRLEGKWRMLPVQTGAALPKGLVC